MRKKIERLTLGKNLIDQSDILQKKAMRHIIGGNYPYCCARCGGESYCGYCGQGTPGECETAMGGGWDGCDVACWTE